MVKFLKITAIFLISLLILLYISFLTVPYFINLDKYKDEIQKIFKENTKLNLDYDSLKLYSTPLLSIGATLDNIKISYDDNTHIFETPKVKLGLAIPAILFLEIKTSNCYIENPKINLEVANYNNEKQYKIVKIIENIINENNAKP